MYIYVYNETDQPQPAQIDAEEDIDAFYKSFDKYAKDRHFVQFKSRMPVDNNIGDEDACENMEFDQVNATEPIVEGADVITGGDSDEAAEYLYLDDIDVNNPPNFTIYKISDTKVADDFKKGLVTLKQLETEDKFRDKVEIIYDNTQHKGIYEKEITKCKEIDYNAYIKMREDFNKRLMESQKKED